MAVSMAIVELPPWLSPLCSEAVIQRCSVKNKNFTKFTGKHLCQSLFFNKVAGLRPATLLKKRLWHRCFPVNFVKFLRTPFFIEHLSWLSPLCLILGKRMQFGIMVFLEAQQINLFVLRKSSEKVPLPFDPVAFFLIFLPQLSRCFELILISQ